MKTSALLMLASAATIATAQDCCDPCEPCCVPKPKKCIDCECYTPPFYDLQCDWGVSLDVEFLYWYAGESNLPLGNQSIVNEVNNNGIGLGLNSAKYMQPSWDPGFRVGLGFNSDCDGWDVNLTYTWYKNTSSTSISANFDVVNPAVGQTVIFPYWVIDQVAFNSTRGSWSLRYNVLDLEMGRKYWLSKCFNLRPFIGIRGAWDKTNFNVRSAGEVSQDTLISVVNSPSYTNRYWGVGVVGGIDPTFYFTPCFALYGQFDMALIWGKAKSKFTLTESLANEQGSSTSSSSQSESHARMQPMYTLGLGVRWEDTYCCDRYRFALDLGWEHTYLDEHNSRLKASLNSQGGKSPESDSVSVISPVLTQDSGLGLGGFVLRARFDF